MIGVATSDISVLYTATNGTITTVSPTAYTVSLNAPVTGSIWGIGGTISMVTPSNYTSGSLTIIRTLPFTQQAAISNQGNQYPIVTETALDTLCMEIQQVAARTGAYRGVWVTGTVYNFGDIVQDGVNGAYTNNIYVAAQGNTSGVWATDLAAGDWVLAISVATLQPGALPLSGGTITGNLSVLGTLTANSFSLANLNVTGNAVIGGVISTISATTGTDITTKLNAAITALPAEGGIIILPTGQFNLSGTIDLSSRRSITIMGQGGRTGGAGSGTILTYTGTASYAFNCHSSIDIVFKDMQIFWNNSGFSGFLIDFLNATYGTISHCQMFANGVSNIGMQGICVNFKNTQNMVIEKCAFGACYNAINGIVDAGSFSNNVVVRDCEFIGSRVGPIQAPGTWCIENCTFEPVTNNTSTAGYAGAIYYSSNVRSQGLVIKNCWFGDVTTGSANWVTLRGDSTVFIGNFMGNNSTGSMLYLINCNGFHSSGNYFTGCYDVYYFDNTGGSCTQFVDDGTNVSNNVSNAVYDGLSNQTSFTQATKGHNIGSNGFLENWGKTAALNVATPTAITFDKAFSVAPYVVLVSTEASSTAGNTVNVSTAATTTGFSVTVTGTGTSKVNWYAKGLA